MLQTDPRSMGGLRLLPKATFHTGHYPTSTHLLRSALPMPTPSDFTSPSPTTPLHQILLTTQTGALALITPLSESSYRRLSGLTTFLANTLDCACGLNAKAWRSEEMDGGDSGQREVLDGGLLMRWGELGEQRRREGLGKVGGDEWVFWGEREVLGGWGVFGRRG